MARKAHFLFYFIFNDLFLVLLQANQQQQDLDAAIDHMHVAANAIQTKRRSVLREQEMLKTSFVTAEQAAKKLFLMGARTQNEQDSQHEKA